MSGNVYTVSGFCISLPENAIREMNTNFNEIYHENSISFEEDINFTICKELIDYIYTNFLNKLKDKYDQILQEKYINLKIDLDYYSDSDYEEDSYWYLFLAITPDFPDINSLIYLNKIFNSDLKIVSEFITFLKTILPELSNPQIEYGTIWYYS